MKFTYVGGYRMLLATENRGYQSHMALFPLLKPKRVAQVKTL
jgi:hypothetical protein